MIRAGPGPDPPAQTRERPRGVIGAAYLESIKDR